MKGLRLLVPVARKPTKKQKANKKRALIEKVKSLKEEDYDAYNG